MEHLESQLVSHFLKAYYFPNVFSHPYRSNFRRTVDSVFCLVPCADPPLRHFQVISQVSLWISLNT